MYNELRTDTDDARNDMGNESPEESLSKKTTRELIRS
jgi:hypothetical protein